MKQKKENKTIPSESLTGVTNLAEQLSRAVLGDVVCDFELSESSESEGMHVAGWRPLTGEVGYLLCIIINMNCIGSLS